MQKYLVFAGDDYYPSGGVADFVGAHDTFQDALFEAPRKDWVQIAELYTASDYDGSLSFDLKIVAEYRDGRWSRSS